jgi:hypothetical protein
MAAAVALAVPLTLATVTPAHAGPCPSSTCNVNVIYNSTQSIYAINVWSDTNCTTYDAPHRVLYPGQQSPVGYASYRVNSPSKFGTRGYGYTNLRSANACVPYQVTRYNNTDLRMDVLVYRALP